MFEIYLFQGTISKVKTALIINNIYYVTLNQNC